MMSATPLKPYEPHLADQEEFQRHIFSDEHGMWYSPDAVRGLLEEARAHYEKQVAPVKLSPAAGWPFPSGARTGPPPDYGAGLTQCDMGEDESL